MKNVVFAIVLFGTVLRGLHHTSHRVLNSTAHLDTSNWQMPKNSKEGSGIFIFPQGSKKCHSASTQRSLLLLDPLWNFLSFRFEKKKNKTRHIVQLPLLLFSYWLKLCTFQCKHWRSTFLTILSFSGTRNILSGYTSAFTSCPSDFNWDCKQGHVNGKKRS